MTGLEFYKDGKDSNMPELNFYTSNRLEILADRLAKTVGNPLPPMVSEIIVVQSKGMKRWISLELAKRLGIWANCRYLFPDEIIREIFKAFIPDLPDNTPYEREVMTFRIMECLPGCITGPEFKSLRNYLSGEEYSLKTYQLSSRIANVFDQYLTFRPEMIMNWKAGEDNNWQAILWRLITVGLPLGHRAALKEMLFKKIRESSMVQISRVLPRISVFGISALPPSHMDILIAMSGYIDVNLFIMNPSKMYWADIRSRRDIAKTLRREGKKGMLSAEDLHLERGNNLLASMGRLGRDFLGLIIEYDPVEYLFFEEPCKDGLLQLVQSDILNMIDRGASPEIEAKRIDISMEEISNDTSVVVHSCHSPMRELEVLYDYLLDLFNNDSKLELHDILVMTPDIEGYAPYIQAVFGSVVDDEVQLPFSIADQGIRSESRVVDTFLSMLDLSGSRFSASKVLDILECIDVRTRFNLSAPDMDLVRMWIKETRICWGIKGSDRGEIGLPEFNENTWNSGIDRILLGYAMPARGESMFQDILPYDNIEGSEALVAGRFIEFFNQLADQINSLSVPRTLGRWSETLSIIIDNFFSSDEDMDGAVQILGNTIKKLSLLEEQSNFNREIDLAVVRSWIENTLNNELKAFGFLTGRITFCAMLPMRSIPFKVICMIGMNNDAFPRREKAVGFDLIAQNPRRGDRSRRSDDRYLFLESIISARENLYISYTGQGVQDNSEIPPSVLVCEFLDYIEQGYAVPGKRITDFIIIKNRLQAFNSHYFREGWPLFSYSAENCMASRAMADKDNDSAAVPFITGRLSDIDWEVKIIEIKDFIKFFDNPARGLLVTRLGLVLDETSIVFNDSEPFKLEGLDKYHLEQVLCERFLSDQDVEPLYRISRSEGLLPHGSPGDFTFRSLILDALNFIQNVKSHLDGNKLESMDISLNISGYNLVGKIGDIWPNGLVRYRYANARAKDRLRAWLLHNIINASGQKSFSGRSFLICKDHSWKMEPLPNGHEILEKLVNIYIKGQRKLLQFFPETSLEYARVLKEKSSHELALKKAMFKWEGDDYNAGESTDSFYELCFNRIVPLDHEFVDLSCEVYKSLLDYQERMK